MKHTVEKLDDISVIVIQGDLWGGAETCNLQCEIKDEVMRLISRGERKFILDLEKTRRINSLGLGVLVAIHVSIQNAGGDLRICSVDERPRAALNVTGLGHLFQVYESREAAVHAFTIGAIGSMILAVMSRVVLGHTGRKLTAVRPMAVAYLLMSVAALARIGAYAAPGGGASLITLAGIAWIAAFAAFLWRHGPMLVRPRPDA